MIGNQLEAAGWRQGSIVRSSDIATLLPMANDPELIFITASQSCDIANNKIETDPYVELSLARRIENLRPHLTHNRHPRILHTHILRRTGDVDVVDHVVIELKAYERFAVPKEALKLLGPDPDSTLDNRQLKSYVAWLAARYSRPALPTAFNDRIRAVDPGNKIREKAKKSNESLSGIYVQILPDTEIRENETYTVNLLGLLHAGFTGDTKHAKTVIEDYAAIMTKAGMDVSAVVRTEDEVSLATISRFKRFYYDDLSLKEDMTLPTETGL